MCGEAQQSLEVLLYTAVDDPSLISGWRCCLARGRTVGVTFCDGGGQKLYEHFSVKRAWDRCRYSHRRERHLVLGGHGTDARLMLFPREGSWVVAWSFILSPVRRRWQT